MGQSETMTTWLAAAPLVLNLPDWAYNQCYPFYKAFIFDNRYLTPGRAGNTLELTFFALMLGLALGCGSGHCPRLLG
jgi:hypothetical protein